jgi:hypothetical protein
MSAKKHAAVAHLHHDGLQEGSAKSVCAKVLDSKGVECAILLLVFVDMALLSVEAGIDHHLLCIDGEVVPRPAGLSSKHHALVQSTWGWPKASQSSDASSQRISKASLSIAAGDQTMQGSEVMFLDVGSKPLYQRVPGTVLHLKQKDSVDKGPVTDDPKGYDTIDNIHSEHKEPQRKEVVHHKRVVHHRGASHDDHAEHDEGHSEHGLHDGGPSHVLMCETKHGHHAHHIAHSCHTASIWILCIFLLEISLKFWVNPVGFMHNWFLILDATVIIVSLITDTIIIMWVKEHDPAHEKDVNSFCAALLFVRCWRVIRIAHGLAEHVHHEHEKEQHAQALTYRSDELEAELRNTKEELRSVRGY